MEGRTANVHTPTAVLCRIVLISGYKMKEAIIVTGKNKVDVAWLRCCLEQQGHSSVLCKTLKALAENLWRNIDCVLMARRGLLCFYEGL